ncbi:MAG: protein-glutamate O-methyltransferase CheR [Anaerofustis sp.]
MISLSDQEFAEITAYMKNNYGIDLHKKRQLIESRMHSVLLKKGMTSFTDYFSLIKSNDSTEISQLINKLTTNHTYFYREPTHFDFMRDVFLPQQRIKNTSKDIRIWSAGCSSGEEAFTAIMVMHDYFGSERSKWDYTILATDISTAVLNAAKTNAYDPEGLKNMPNGWLNRYFQQTKEGSYTLSRDVSDQVVFRTFNLMDRFEYKKPYDLIFCRNVMIYFDLETKTNLVNKFYDALKPGGYLFIGHSESVQHGRTKFQYVQPSIYQKGRAEV